MYISAGPLGATRLRRMLHVLQDLCCLQSCHMSESSLFIILLLIVDSVQYRSNDDIFMSNLEASWIPDFPVWLLANTHSRQHEKPI